MTITYLIVSVIAVLALWFAATYNRFIILKKRVKEAFSDIDVQLKRRFDLIPNLVSTVKGYMSHEKSVLEDVTKARTEIQNVHGNPLDRAEAENHLSATLKTLFAVAENYPDLKANTNFLDLQRELSDTENKIQASRRFYNGNVRELNIKVHTFPSVVIANIFKFKEEPFFETENEEERKNVEVKF
ncbi:MAG: LemA family protein [Parcubacteria group bacterium]